MAVDIIRDAPSLDSYTPLQEHQEQTPGTFFGGKPVLYHRASNAKLVVNGELLNANEAFSGLRSAQDEPTSAGAPTNGNTAPNTTSSRTIIPDLDIWVTSENFILYSPKTHFGLAIIYPSISLHALQRLTLPSAAPSEPEIQALYVQLNLTSHEETDDIETFDFSLVPESTAASSHLPNPEALAEEDGPAPSPAQTLYNAVTACADLHPDPRTPGTDGGQEGDASTMPGAGGWITSENMAEYMDEEGNFIGFQQELGPGAGTVRGRDVAGNIDGEDETGAGDGGEDGESEETKWRRTD